MELKPLYLLVQLGLVLYTDVLDLFNFNQIENDQLLVKSEDVKQRAYCFDLCYLRVRYFFYFEVVAEHVVDDDHASDRPENNLVELLTYCQATQR